MRKLFLLFAVVVAAMAFAAPSASAQVHVAEAGGVPGECSSMAPGYCEIHIVANDANLQVHFLGTQTFVCNVEIDAHVFSDGSGVTENVHIRAADGDETQGNCENLVECHVESGVGSNEERAHYPTSLAEAAGVLTFTIEICIDPPILSECEGEVHATVFEPVGHVYTAEPSLAGNENDGTRIEDELWCEFGGHYQLEEPNIEILHG